MTATAPETSVGSCSISADTTGTVLFSTDCNGNVFSSIVAADGTLTAAAGSPFATGGTELRPVTGDPSGTFVYVGEDSNATMISAFNYSSPEVHTPITGTRFAPAGTFTEGIVITH